MIPADIAAKVIRPLVWQKLPWGDYLGAFGYRIEVYGGSWPARLYKWRDVIGKSYRSIAAAQAAAEADYRARICAALDLDAVVALVGALAPFKAMAGEMFARNWNRDDVAIQLGTAHSPHRLTFGDFHELHAALSPFTPNTEPKP